ncbi:NTP transferase domain-containing protein [Maribacter algicola]|uniref:NTP transferase domain-containing protein n=1 Tax=Meishania litoralis TaxID=3434685 RepID=A0ACC7LPA2_9FLAO
MNTAAKLYGLVLSGGKSTRMGSDKGLIAYHGIPQREYLYQLLGEVCERTYISLRKEQEAQVPFGYATLTDKDRFRGPFNGILSAHERHPEAAWLVLACDLPLIDLPSLEQLVQERDSGKFATAFANKENPLPEPLCAIWEPEGLKTAVAYLEAGNGTCPRKFLINNETKLVFPNNENVILNANSQEDYQEALSKLTT